MKPGSRAAGLLPRTVSNPGSPGGNVEREKRCRARLCTAHWKKERNQPARRMEKRDASLAAPATAPGEEVTLGWGATGDGCVPATRFFTTNFCATK